MGQWEKLLPGGFYPVHDGALGLVSEPFKRVCALPVCYWRLTVHCGNLVADICNLKEQKLILAHGFRDISSWLASTEQQCSGRGHGLGKLLWLPGGTETETAWEVAPVTFFFPLLQLTSWTLVCELMH